MRVIVSFMILVALLAGVEQAMAQSAFDAPGQRRGGGGAINNDGPGLVATQPNIQGGDVVLGTTAQVVVLFRNDSADAIDVKDVKLYPSSGITSVAQNDCGLEPLVPGAECPIILAVKPLQAGSWRIEMLVSHTGRSRLVTTKISGNVVLQQGTENAQPVQTDIEAAPGEIDFGQISSGRTLVRSAVLRNITSESIKIEKIALEAATDNGYSYRSNCEVLGAGQACLVSVLWTPRFKGEDSAILLVHHDGPAGLLSIPLTGTLQTTSKTEAEIFPEGVAGKGLMISDVTEIDLGTGISNITSQTVSLVNDGDTSMTIEDVTLSGSDNGISISKRGCKAGTVLKPTDACALTIFWAPLRAGTVSDHVQIRHDGVRGILVLPISGTATQSVGLSSSSSSLLRSEGGEDGSVQEGGGGQQLRPALDGYVVTSLSRRSGIISGPTGSRVVRDGQKTVLGGISWDVTVTRVGVELINGNDRILLIFDESLSSINRAATSDDSSE